MLNFQILSMASDGIIAVLINKKRYTYSIDTALFPKVKKLSKYKNGECLNFIKNNSILIEKEK